MAKAYKKDWKKMTALGLGGLTVLISICGGLLVANFIHEEPVLVVNLILGAIAGVGISIVSGFQIVNTYKYRGQARLKKKVSKNLSLKKIKKL